MVNKETNQLSPIGTPVMADLIPIYDINDTAELKSTTIQKILDTGYVGALTSDAQTQINKKSDTISTLYEESFYDLGKLSNTHIVGSQGIVTYNGNQYFLGINQSDQLVLLKRTVGEKTWSSNTLTTKTITNPTDNHNTGTLGIDASGRLHIWYDHHSSALKYFRMPTPESIVGTPGANTSMTGSNESSVTYIGIVYGQNRKMFCLYRSGISGDGDLYLKVWDNAGATWSGAIGTDTDGLLVRGSTLVPDENFYWSLPYYDSVNHVFHFGGVWRETTDESTNHDVSYLAYFEDTGEIKKADGTVLTAPVTLATIDIVDAVAKSQDLQAGVNAMYCTLDTNDRPILVYRKNDTGGVQQYFTSSWNGSAWTTPKQLTSGIGDWENNTSVNILRDANKALYVLFGSTQYGDGLHVIETRDSFTTWVIYKLSNSFGQVREVRNIDWDLWNTSNVLNAVFQHGNDRNVTYEIRKIWMLYWKPLEGKTVPLSSIHSIWVHESVDMTSLKGVFRFLCEDARTGGSMQVHVYNSNGYIQMGNSSAVAGRFAPAIIGAPNDPSVGLSIQSFVDPGDDSGTVPAVIARGKRSDGQLLTTKPLFGVSDANNTFPFTVDFDGTVNCHNEGIINFKLQFENAITPSQITTNQNNYNPSGMSDSSWLRLSTDASRDITGISAPTKRKLLLISNIGSFNIVLKNESASSTAANRFALSADVTIAPKQGVIIVYDVTQSRWTAFGSTATGGLNNVVEDTTPQLGGNLDFNTFKATGVPNPTANDEIVNKAYFEANTEAVAGTKAAYKVIARDATNTGNEWTLLTNNHLSGSAGITYANLQNVSATDRILGRDSSGAGVIEEITPTALRTMINVADGANNYSHPNHSGEVTSTGDGAQVLAASAITNRTQDELPEVDSDYLLTYDTSGTALKKVLPRDIAGDFAFLRQGYKRGVIVCGTNDTKVSNGCLSFGTSTGTASGYISTTGKALNWVTASSTDADAGERGIATSGHTRGDHSPLIAARFEVDSMTNNRFFFGLANTTALLTGDTPLSALSGIAFVKKAGTNDLYLVTNNGTTAEEDDTTIDLADATPIILAIRTTDGGTTWQYSISSLSGGAWQTVSSAVLPGATTGLNFFIQIETSNTTAKNLRLYGMGALFK